MQESSCSTAWHRPCPSASCRSMSSSEVTYTNDRLHSIVGTPRAGTVEEQLASVIDEDRRGRGRGLRGGAPDGVDSDIEVRLRPYGASDKEIRYCTLNLRALTDAYGAVTRGHRVPGGCHRERTCDAMS